jgi:hypothetical protein
MCIQVIKYSKLYSEFVRDVVNQLNTGEVH